MPNEQTEFQDELVRGLAHRMNNILTLFHGYLGLLVDNKTLDKPTLAGLAKIKDGARAASDLIDRTQTLVRPSTTVLREIDLAAFVGMLTQGFESIRGPRTKLEFDIPESVPLIHGDASRVKAALVELVKNACEATFASGGTVCIVLRGDAPPANSSHAAQPLRWVSFSVTDDGPGVPEEIADRIFAPFFSTKKKQNAAGLGLSVAQGVANQHNGTLRLKSGGGKTTFELRLPAYGE